MRDRRYLICPSVLNYVLRVKKVEIANCEAISQALLFEKELEEWNAGLSCIEEKEEEIGGDMNE